MPADADDFGARVATPADAADVTAIFADAFHEDPLWGHWLEPDGAARPAALAALWAFFVEEALRYPWVRTTARGEAASLWIPPGGTEVSPAGEARLAELAARAAGDRDGELIELWDRFDAARPDDEPHYYLSLLGTRSDHRGRGIGMALLEADLRLIDEEGAAARLESTNPANMPRYERAGFEAVGSFEAPGGGPVVTTMRRPPR
jgi:GNAT superfamily N-acetyltransferase